MSPTLAPSSPFSLIDFLKQKLAVAHDRRARALAGEAEHQAKAREMREIALRNEGVISVLEQTIAEMVNAPSPASDASKEG